MMMSYAVDYSRNIFQVDVGGGVGCWDQPRSIMRSSLLPYWDWKARKGWNLGSFGVKN